MSQYGNYISTLDDNIILKMRTVYESFPLPMKPEEYIFYLSSDLFKQYNREVNYIIYRENDDIVRGKLYFRGVEVKKIDDQKSMKRIVLTPIKNLNYEI